MVLKEGPPSKPQTREFLIILCRVVRSIESIFLELNWITLLQ